MFCFHSTMHLRQKKKMTATILPVLIARLDPTYWHLCLALARFLIFFFFPAVVVDYSPVNSAPTNSTFQQLFH